MQPLSVVVTTFNSAATLATCLDSVRWADEIVVLDSYSQDETAEIAQRYGARFHQQEFLGFGPQKQSAIDRASHRWALLLDDDECLSPASQVEIRALLAHGPRADGYRLPRLEQLFWRMSRPQARMQRFLRLFDRSRTRLSDSPVHAAPQVDGRVENLRCPFHHFGQPTIEYRIEKINRYTSEIAAHATSERRAAQPWMLAVYPPLWFARQYFLRRQLLNGWAGFIAAALDAFYVFLKYAKSHECAQRNARAPERRRTRRIDPREHRTGQRPVPRSATP